MGTHKQICEGGDGFRGNPPEHDGLTVERLIDSVVRAEEHAPAQDEGDENDSPSPEEIDYLLGGYNDPAYERNGR